MSKCKSAIANGADRYFSIGAILKPRKEFLLCFEPGAHDVFKPGSRHEHVIAFFQFGIVIMRYFVKSKSCRAYGMIIKMIKCYVELEAIKFGFHKHLYWTGKVEQFNFRGNNKCEFSHFERAIRLLK